MIPSPFITQAFTSADINARAWAENAPPYIACHVDEASFSATSTDEPPDWVRELVKTPTTNTTGKPPLAFFQVPEWSPALEMKFRRLAEDKAINKLSLKGRVEFEKLMAIRRQVKNPRSGEEVLIEYQQRVITRDLVNALLKYVNFHNRPNPAR